MTCQAKSSMFIKSSKMDYTGIMICFSSLNPFIFFYRKYQQVTGFCCRVQKLRNSAKNHCRLFKTYMHRQWLIHADMHMCTHGCMYKTYIARSTCYITYISFSKLGFEALHVQSDPCSRSLNRSVETAKKKGGEKKPHRCLNLASVMLVPILNVTQCFWRLDFWAFCNIIFA